MIIFIICDFLAIIFAIWGLISYSGNIANQYDETCEKSPSVYKIQSIISFFYSALLFISGFTYQFAFKYFRAVLFACSGILFIILAVQIMLSKELGKIFFSNN